MPFSDAQRSYMIREQLIGPFIINFLLNWFIAWLAFHKVERIDVWGEQGIVGDLVVTMFLLPFIVCLIATPIVRSMVKRGKIEAFTSAEGFPPLALRLPNSLLLRALLIGFATTLLLSPPVVGLLAATGWQDVSSSGFALIKGVWCGVVAAAISPHLALKAIAESLGSQPQVAAA